MLTSTISTFFFSAINKNDNKEKGVKAISHEYMLDISDLSTDERMNLISYYHFLKSKDS